MGHIRGKSAADDQGYLNLSGFGKGLIALVVAGLVLIATIVVTTVTGAASATGVPPAPRAPVQDHFVHLPLVAKNYPPGPPVYRLYADPGDLAWLARSPYRNETIPATFVHERSWDVDIRYRGDVSRLMSKKCWKVFFPGSDLFQGQEELNLNADYPDQTLLRSYTGYDFFARVGVPTPRAGYARLYINDEHYGLFSQVEQIDKLFLYRLGIEIHGNLYKPFYGNLRVLDYIEDPEERNWWYRYYYPKKTNRQSGNEDIIAFIELINYTSDEYFPEAITEVLDVNGWLDWYAVNVLIGNFEMLEKNYYLYHDLSTDRWLVLPWDVDLTFGHNMWGPGIGGLLDEEISWDNPIDSGTEESKKIDGKWNMLIDRMMDVSEFRFFYCRRLKELMADEFSPAEMFPRIDAAFAYIYPWAEADPHRWQPEGFQFSDGPDELKTYITNRISFLEGEMPGFCPGLEAPLVVNEFMADNGGILADESGDYDDWIDIYNGSSMLTWDLGGMYLTDDLSEPTKWRIPDGTLIPPGGTLLFWADGEQEEGLLHTNFELGTAGGQIGLFDRDVFGNTAISVLTYAAQATDVSYGRMPDGGETWQFFASPTPGWLNQGRPPVIGGTGRAPVWPTSSDAVTVATLISDEGATLTTTLWVRAFEPGAPPPPYEQMVMYDDGDHGDGGPSDGIYGALIPPHVDGTWVEYYVEAEDEAGMVTVDRPGWPQGDYGYDYRYIVGWQRPPLAINELMALNTHTLEDEDGDHDDWIELYNAGTEDIDMSGMYFSDNIGSSTQYTVPTGTVIRAGEHRIFWADDDGDGDHLNFKLSGAGEYVGLFDSQAGYYAPIDAVYFDPQTPDVSWGRFPDGGSEWHAMDTPTPGGPNRLLPPQFSQVTRTPTWPGAGDGVTVTAVITAGSPIVSVTLWYDAGSGFQPVSMASGSGTSWQLVLPSQPEGTLVNYYLEAVDGVSQRTLHPASAPTVTHSYLVGYVPPAVLINEFLADNESVNQDEAGEYDDWVELYNGSTVTVTLDGMALTDDLSEPTKWQFPTGTTISPGGHLLVWCDRDTGQGLLHANFKLSLDGEEIGLFDSGAHGNVPLDTVVFGPQQEDVSYGRRPDGSDTWEFLDPPTPGASHINDKMITVCRGDFHGGTITEDTTLLVGECPYVITDDIVVPAGLTLTIEPGVTLRFQAGRSLRVEEGRLVAEGTPSLPILFTRDNADSWGAIVFKNSASDNRIAYATVEYAGTAEYSRHWQGITAYDSELRVEHSTIHHLDGWKTGLFLGNSTAQVLDNVIYDVGEDGIHIVGGDVIVQGNHVYDAYEGIELEFMVTPAVLLDNHVHDISDDCLDLDASTAVIERNELHHCGDKGISLGFTSSATMVNNLVYASTEGIAVQDGSSARIVNNTVAGNQRGVGLHKHYLESGGFATLVNCIVWGNGIPLEVRDGSVITVTYSGIEGGWPGEGNINADPLFRAPQSGNYRLGEDSPYVDTGSPVGAPDMDIRDVYRPHGEGYDRGVYEFSEFFSLYLSLVLRSY